MLLYMLSWGQLRHCYHPPSNGGYQYFKNKQKKKKKRKVNLTKNIAASKRTATWGHCVKNVCAFSAGIWSGERALWKAENSPQETQTRQRRHILCACSWSVLEAGVEMNWGKRKLLIWNVTSSWHSHLDFQCSGKMFRVLSNNLGVCLYLFFLLLSLSFSLSLPPSLPPLPFFFFFWLVICWCSTSRL